MSIPVPAYSLQYGVYGTLKFSNVTNGTFFHTKMMLEHEYAFPAIRIPTSRWEYKNIALRSIVDDWVLLWNDIWNVKGIDSMKEVYDMCMRGDIDGERLVYEFYKYDDPRVILDIRSDVKRFEKILRDIEQSGRYWPPCISKGYDSLDGAHRLVVLMRIFGMDGRADVWQHKELLDLL